MKKTIISGVIFIISLWIVQNLYGQPVENRLERFHAQKIAFFTNKLQLTPEEAEKFWPLYNEYTNRKRKMEEESRSLMRGITQNADNLPEKDMHASVEKYIRLQEEIHQLFLEFHTKYMDILPANKVIKIYITEDQFKTYLLHQIREERSVRAPVRK